MDTKNVADTQHMESYPLHTGIQFHGLIQKRHLILGKLAQLSSYKKLEKKDGTPLSARERYVNEQILEYSKHLTS